MFIPRLEDQSVKPAARLGCVSRSAGTRLCLVLAAVACALVASESRAQLAITEAMSWTSTNCASCVNCHPDFWELTNFGTNTVDLTGYLFTDKNADLLRNAWRLEGITIRPSESIIFVREGWPEVSDAAGFRAWWGNENIPADLQVFFYPGHGFDELGDAVRFADPNTNLLDEVYFGETKRGVTFSYDTNSGGAAQSEVDVCGAFEAVRCGDIGSPGWAPCGRVPLQMTQPPTAQTVDAGNTVTFRIRASGLPRPRFQWYFNGEPILETNAFATSVPRLVAFAGCGTAWVEKPAPPDLTLLNVQPDQSGEYFVEVFNGLEKLTSAVVRLTVNASVHPLELECPLELTCADGNESSPASLVAAHGQTTTFSILARGYPLPTFQWAWSPNGTSYIDLPGQTNRELVIPSVTATDAGTYRVRAQNSVNSLNASVALVVKPKPRLRITEAMSDPIRPDGCDWWELTNLGDEAVDLCGYRWDDDPGLIGAGPTVSHSVLIQPLESVIFIEGKTPEFFRNWWGERNLPRQLRFIRYTANSLQKEGDEISVWNPTATLDFDWVDAVSFSTATSGASHWFAPNDFCAQFGVVSVAGECGAFHSADGYDVGSPGWTPWTPPTLTSIRHQGSTVRLEWRAQVGSTNLVEYTDALESANEPTAWSELTRVPAVLGGTVLDTSAGDTARRFYRVRTIAPAPCASCP